MSSMEIPPSFIPNSGLNSPLNNTNNPNHELGETSSRTLKTLHPPINSYFSSVSSSSSPSISTCSSPEVSAPASPSAALGDAAYSSSSASPASASASSTASAASAASAAFKAAAIFGNLPRLVIFDKDGTLICFHSMWHPWLQGFIKRIETASGLVFEDSLNATYGFNVAKQKFDAGLMAEGTMDQCKEGAVRTVAEKLGRETAEKIVSECWKDCDTSSSKTLRLTCDVVPVLDALHSRGVKIAMCTADTRKGAMGAIEKLDLARYFDMIVAGGDDDYKPKPDPHNAKRICRELCVTPKDAVMIGDTKADTEFGKNAGLGMTLGVLSGIGDRGDLRAADDVIDHVGQLFQVFPALKSQTE